MDTTDQSAMQADQIRDLVRRLAEAEEALQAQSAGRLDADIDPAAGAPILLRRAQDRLREEEARLRLLMQQIPAVVWATDGELRITSISGSGLADLGLTLVDLVGQPMAGWATDDEDLVQALAAHRRALEGEPVCYEMEFGGHSLQASIEPLRGADGEIVGCVGVAVDVSAHKCSEETLRRVRDELEERVQERTAKLSQALEELRSAGEELGEQNVELVVSRQLVETERRRYVNLFDFAPDGYLVTDTDGVVLEANRAAAVLLRVGQDALAGKPLSVFVVAGQRRAYLERLAQLLRHGRVDGWELQLQPRGGEAFHAAVTAAVVQDVEDGATRLRWLVRDVTEHKRTEEIRERLLAQIQQDREWITELATELERERSNLETLMEHTPAHLAYLDRDLTFVRVNSAFAQGAGFRKGELIGRHYFELFPDAENRTIFEQVLATGEPARFLAKPFAFPSQTTRGAKFWNWTLVPVKGEQGQVEGLVFSLADVTERERTREVVRRYAHRLEVFHLMDRAILGARSPQECAEAALPYLHRLLGCKRASVTEFDLARKGVALLALHSEDKTERMAGWVGSIDDEPAGALDQLAQGQPFTVNDLQAQPDLSSNMEPLRAEGIRALVVVPLLVREELIGTLNLGMPTPGQLAAEQMEIAREMANQLAIAIHQARMHRHVQSHAVELERQVARRTRALQISEARFRAVFEESPIGIVLTTRRGRMIDSNAAGQRILGADNEHLRGRLFSEMLGGPPEVAEAGGVFAALIGGERASYRREWRYVRPDGDAVWINLTLSPVSGEEGRARYVIAMLDDVTERRETRMALVQAEKLVVMGRFAATMAHEINNPLQAVIGCLGLAREALAAGETDAERFLDVAADELHRAADIVSQMRDINRPPDMGQREPSDVNALLERVLALAEKKSRSQRVALSLETVGELPPVPLVPDRMHQVFLNLVLNAIEAMGHGGTLRASTDLTEDPPGVAILFADTGPGIPPDVKERLFEPFHTTKPEGVGLGLYISQTIVKEHGGHIEVESEVGNGTTFKVWLPV